MGAAVTNYGCWSTHYYHKQYCGYGDDKKHILVRGKAARNVNKKVLRKEKGGYLFTKANYTLARQLKEWNGYKGHHHNDYLSVPVKFKGEFDID